MEKEREREREKERERFIRERREREEKERKEREREREQLERERLERERLERERRERERLENERIAREKEERERVEKERMAREEQEFRIERERLRLEKERLERERTERDRRGILVDRGLGSKRSLVPDERRDYNQDAKRSARDASPPNNARKDFFSPPGGNNRNNEPADHNQYGSGNDSSYDRHASRSGGRDDSSFNNRGSSREENRSVSASNRHDSRSTNQRGGDYDSTKDRSSSGGYNNQQTSDIRRVVQRDSENDNYNSRDRSPHRSDNSRYGSSRGGGSDHGQRNQSSWSDSNPSSVNANAPKTLSDVLGRAGLTGILGSRAEEKSEKSFQPRVNDPPSSRSSNNDRYSSSYGTNDVQRQDRGGAANDRSLDRGLNSYRDTRDTGRGGSGADSRDRRPDDYQRTRVDDRRDNRYDERRPDDRSGDRPDDRNNSRPDERPALHNDNNRNDYHRGFKLSRNDDFRDDNRHDNSGPHDKFSHDNRPQDNRPDRSRDLSQAHLRNPGFDNGPKIISATDRRGLHPLAADIGTSLVPTIIQPRVLPLADVFGRPLQAVTTNPAQALQAGYAAAQGLTLGHTGIQLNRNGRLEYTRMPPPQNSVGLNRRF